MKNLLKLGLVMGLLGSYAVADYVPGTVDTVLQNGATVAIYIKRTDNNTVIHRNLPAAQEKNLLAMLLTAMTAGKTVSCNVNGAVFDKCFVYSTPR